MGRRRNNVHCLISVFVLIELTAWFSNTLAGDLAIHRGLEMFNSALLVKKTVQ